MFSGNYTNFLRYLVLKIRSDQSQGDLPNGYQQKKNKSNSFQKNKAQ